MMKEKFLSKSASALTLILIITLGFFKGNVSHWIMAVAFGGWLIYVAVMLLARNGKKLKAAIRTKKTAMQIKRALKKAENSEADSQENAESSAPEGVIYRDDHKFTAEQQLAKYVNLRITTLLRVRYPDLTWQWDTGNPVSLSCNGGKGRIRTTGTEEFNAAELIFGGRGQIKIIMLKMAPLDPISDETPKEKGEKPEKPDAVDWYEIYGREKLTSIIDDLNTRNHSALSISANGEVYVKNGNGNDDRQDGPLKNMPDKSTWDKLVDLISCDDLNAEIQNERLYISWSHVAAVQ